MAELVVLQAPGVPECCSGAEVCRAEVDLAVFLEQGVLIMPCTDALFRFNRTISNTTQHYVTSGGEAATITRNQTAVFGTISLANTSYILDYRNSTQLWYLETDEEYGHLATLDPPGGQECCRNTSCPAHVDVAMFAAGVGGHLPCSSSLFLLTSTPLPHTHRYSSTEGDAVLTYDTASDTIFGNIRIGDHRYTLDYVGSSYVWEEEDDRYEDEGDDDPPPPAPAADNTTMAEVSCLIYITKEFINETKDITGFVKNMTDATN